MLIEVKKFGNLLSSRQTGKEAYAAFRPSLNELSADEKIIIDFSGVSTLTPSWADEFLTPILKEYDTRVSITNSDNPSVQATLNFLESIK